MDRGRRERGPSFEINLLTSFLAGQLFWFSAISFPVPVARSVCSLFPNPGHEPPSLSWLFVNKQSFEFKVLRNKLQL